MISNKEIKIIKKLVKSINKDFIIHISELDDSYSIHLMHKKGRAFARAYCYYDDNDNIYLDSLSVSSKFRNRKLGTLLQIIRETIGRTLNYKYSCLSASSGSWQYEWYKRRGYVETEPNIHLEGTVWMIKELI